jgi:hypothetical protein
MKRIAVILALACLPLVSLGDVIADKPAAVPQKRATNWQLPMFTFAGVILIIALAARRRRSQSAQ